MTFLGLKALRSMLTVCLRSQLMVAYGCLRLLMELWVTETNIMNTDKECCCIRFSYVILTSEVGRIRPLGQQSSQYRHQAHAEL